MEQSVVIKHIKLYMYYSSSYLLLFGKGTKEILKLHANNSSYFEIRVCLL